MITKIASNPHLIYQDWILTEIQFDTNLWLHARTKSSQIQLGMAAQITLSGVNGTLENDAQASNGTLKDFSSKRG
jgi:hypothetical protein